MSNLKGFITDLHSFLCFRKDKEDKEDKEKEVEEEKEEEKEEDT